MSRVWEQYPAEEKIELLQSLNSGHRRDIEKLMSEINELQFNMYLFQEVIDKLPKKERDLTWKRFRLLQKKHIK